ncbi:hypothetical protein Tco_0621687 [Tanacetum coccineum]
MEFTNEGRIAWVEVEGIPFKLWTDNTFKRIATKWGELLDIDDQEESVFYSKRLYTLGWVLTSWKENDDEEQSDVDSKEGEFKVHDTGIYGGDSDVEEARETLFEKSGKKENNLDEEHKYKQEKNSEGHFKKSGVPRTGGSILNLMDELVKVGQVMGYKMDGCEFYGLAQKAKKDWVNELCVKNKVNFMALQETKMENMELFSVKMCWGNFAFDYVHSDSVGNSGGANVFNSFITNAGLEERIQEELEALEAIIDRGDGNEEIVNKRTEVVNNIQKFDKIHSSEMAQKAKLILNIRGIMVDGNWIESPKAVKGEFFQHFSSRFDKPDASRATINMRYPKTLTYDQQNELESEVSNVEIKRAVWDCGTDKSPGPDGFTFGFPSVVFGTIIENGRV